jgi:hypothetical protein
MRFMNTWEIDAALERYGEHSTLGPATRTLASLRDAADAHSDGWCYWPAPCRAAAKLIELIERADSRRLDGGHEPTSAELSAAYRPLKSFRTRSGLAFEIHERSASLF